jgi:hypothetical protein
MKVFPQAGPPLCCGFAARSSAPLNQRVECAPEQDGQTRKLTDVELSIPFRHHDRNDLNAEQTDKKPGEYSVNPLHIVLRLKVKPSKCVANWTTKPNPTSIQEKYGVSQLGLWTTCRIVPWLSVSKLAW